MKILSFLLIFFILLTLLPTSTLAQSSPDPWSEPVNISYSGAATDPVMVVDSDRIIHVFWTDEFDGPMYSRREGDEWSAPVQVSVPFEGYLPLIRADSGGYLHAFWIDGNQVLRYANVAVSAIHTSSWSPTEIMADYTIVFDVEIDDLDRFHLTFLRVVDLPGAPAGVYFRRSEPRGDGWANPSLLYPSPYFRKLTSAEAHIDVDISGTNDPQQVFVTWDNRPRARVFLASSDDGGLNWSDPLEIDEPEEGIGSASPFNLTVSAQNGKVLLIWQTGSQAIGCSQYYQWSLDGGGTWQSPQRFSDRFFGCPTQIHVLKGLNEPIVLLVENQIYLQAWDGTRWSDLQIQSSLTSFTDPETEQAIDLACQQALMVKEQLFVVGCATTVGGVGGGDIWWLQRELDDVSDWFPQESLWQPLTSVVRGDFRFLSLTLVADADERWHLIWSQTGGPSYNMPDSALYYTRWEGERLWSQPVPILASPQDPADQPAVALGSAERLFTTWRRGEGGEIYFSQVSANLAALRDAWIEPVRVSSSDHLASEPDIVVSDGGVIYITYAVPVNEGRGIYLTYSSDGGRSWSAPLLVFDGAVADWTMLGQPHLALKGEKDLHLLWTRYSLISGKPEPVGLAYARSLDGGMNWSEQETVVEDSVAWSRILGSGNGTVHRFWQEITTGQTTTLWHERSRDDGVTWERITPIFIFGQAAGNPSLIWDRAGKLHLLQVVSRETAGYMLQHWIWEGERWGGGGNLNLDVEDGTSIDNMASAVSLRGKLAVVLSGRVESQVQETQQDELFFTVRSVDPPEGLPTPLPPLLEMPVVTQEQPTLEPTLLPTPSPTPNLAVLNPGRGNSSSPWTGLMIGGILAGLVVAIAFGLGLKKVKIGH